MAILLDFLTTHGKLLAAGATLVLLLGTIAAASVRSHAHRQRTCELTLVGVLGWLILACVPLPRARWQADWIAPGGVSQRPTEDPSQDKAQAARDGRSTAAAATADSKPWSRHRADENELAHETLAEDDQELAGELARIWRPTPWQADRGLPGTASTAGRRGSGNVADARQNVPQPVEPIGGGEASGRVRRATSHHESWRQWSRRPTAWYLTGAALTLGWLATGRILLWRMMRQARLPDEWLHRLYVGLLSSRRARRARLVVLRSCRRPFSYGLLRPVIVLPLACCRRRRAESISQVLRHEIAHVERRDAWGQFCCNLLLPLLYLHPVYWWLRRQIDWSRELIADDWAARQTSAVEYATELVSLARWRGYRSAPLAGVLGAFGSRHTFFRRMSMLIQREHPLVTQPSRCWRIASMTAMTCCVGLLAWFFGVQPMRAQQPGDSDTAEPAAGAPAAVEVRVRVEPTAEDAAAAQAAIEVEGAAAEEGGAEEGGAAVDGEIDQVRDLLIQKAKQLYGKIPGKESAAGMERFVEKIQQATSLEQLAELSVGLAEMMAAIRAEQLVDAAQTDRDPADGDSADGGQAEIANKLAAIRKKVMAGAEKLSKIVDDPQVAEQLRMVMEKARKTDSVEELQAMAQYLSQTAQQLRQEGAARKEKMQAKKPKRKKVKSPAPDATVDALAALQAKLAKLRAQLADQGDEPSEDVEKLQAALANLQARQQELAAEAQNDAKLLADLVDQVAEARRGKGAETDDEDEERGEQLENARNEALKMQAMLAVQLMAAQDRLDEALANGEAQRERAMAAMKQALEEREISQAQRDEALAALKQVMEERDAAQAAEQRSREVGSGLVERQAAGGALLDLVSLANSVTEAHGNVEMAALKLDQLAELQRANSVSEQEVGMAKVAVNTSLRKLQLLQAITKASLAAQESSLEHQRANLEICRKLVETGAATQQEVLRAEAEMVQAESSVQVLRLILQSAE